MDMENPGYDDTDMTREEFHRRLDAGIPAEVNVTCEVADRVNLRSSNRSKHQRRSHRARTNTLRHCQRPDRRGRRTFAG